MDFSFVKDFMDHLTAWRIPGNSISIRLEGKEVFRYQSGYSDKENGIRMSEDRLFNIYSCSKVATVVAALQLYERGRFLLDDPLYAILPEYREMWIRQPDGEMKKAENPITLRHLFTMTAGLTYDRTTPPFEKARRLTDGRMDTVAVARCLAADPLSFEPGTAWQYSLCHDVLATVVEVVSGVRFAKYVKQNIFSPLGMNESYYHNDAVQDRLAEQYQFLENGQFTPEQLQARVSGDAEGCLVNVGKGVGYVFGPGYDSGGAGITTSVHDYSLFASALANGGVGINGERILAPGTIELLRTNQLTEKTAVNFNWEALKGYGYGLGVRTLVNRALSGTTGSIGEFGWCGAAGGMLLVDPDRRLSMFYAHHMLNPQESYYMPRLRNVLYTCL